MIYIKGLLSLITVTIGVYILFYNVIFRFSNILNRILAAIALISIAEFTSFFLITLNLDWLPNVMLARIYLCMLFSFCLCMFLLSLVYPDIGKRKNFLFYMLVGIPGYLMIYLILFTNALIVDVPFVGYDNRTLNKKFYGIYVLSTTFLSFGAVIIIFIKTRFKKHRFLRKDGVLFLLGMTFAIISGNLLMAVLPRLGITEARDISNIMAGLLLLLVINAGSTDIRRIDMKKFYIDFIFWLVVAFLLFGPVAMIMKFTMENIKPIPINYLGIAMIIFLYLFLFFKYVKPKLEDLFEREYQRLSTEFNDFFKSVKKLDMGGDNISYWNRFYEESIDNLIKKYDITHGHLYVYNYQEHVLKLAHSAGEKIEAKEIEPDSPLARYLEQESGILSTSILSADKQYLQYRDEILRFFIENNTEIAIPFFGSDKKLVGVLFLGHLPGKRLYSKTFISAMELFRIQFQLQLANGLVLDEIKQNQIIRHDNMVVDSVKKKINPKEMKQIPGFRISSFNMNNSAYGGDYYDSILLNKEKVAVFIADTSYAGVDSAILALELYTIFNTNLRSNESPEKILNIMNWVISTSRYTKKYTPAQCLTYSSNGQFEFSNAAFNPVIIYDSSNDSFSELNSQGIPIGVDREFVYEMKQFRLKSGSVGVIFSDGLISAINSSGESFGIEGLKSVLRSASTNSPAVITRELYMKFSAFIGDQKQLNDITCIVFKV